MHVLQKINEWHTLDNRTIKTINTLIFFVSALLYFYHPLFFKSSVYFQKVYTCISFYLFFFFLLLVLFLPNHLSFWCWFYKRRFVVLCGLALKKKKNCALYDSIHPSRHPQLRGSTAPPIHGSVDEPAPFVPIFCATNSRPQIHLRPCANVVAVLPPWSSFSSSSFRMHTTNYVLRQTACSANVTEETKFPSLDD